MRTGYEMAIDIARRQKAAITAIGTDDGCGDRRIHSSLEQARPYLDAMTFYVDPAVEVREEQTWWGDPRPRGAPDYTFALWFEDGVLVFLDMNEGYADPYPVCITPQAWVSR